MSLLWVIITPQLAIGSAYFLVAIDFPAPQLSEPCLRFSKIPSSFGAMFLQRVLLCGYKSEYDAYASEVPISKRRSRPLQRRTPGHFAPEID